jgi:hypothetical protein
MIGAVDLARDASYVAPPLDIALAELDELLGIVEASVDAALA